MQQNKIIILVTILSLLCLCLAFAGGLGIGYGLSDTFESPLANQQPTTPEPDTYEPPERPAQAGQLLLEDDFSQKRWPALVDNEHRKGYAEGQYFFLVEAEGYSYWSLAEETYQDFILEVETRQLDGPDNNDYGVMLRYQDDANFYSFEISGDGFYTFSKLVDDELFEIIPWQESDAINLGNRRNMLRVEAVGSNFTFYVNDELVDAAIDSEFSQGDIGLLAGTFQDPGVHVAFDNLKVWAVE